MMRVEDWPLRLNAHLDSARDRAFVWGEHDCALFAANWVRQATGVDYAAAYRDRYATPHGAARVLKTQGPGTLRAAVGQALGAEIPALKAQRGDLLLWQQAQGGDTVGICTGAEGAFAGPGGLVMVPLRDCAAGWRV